MSAGAQVVGQQDVATNSHEYNTMAFVFRMLLQNVQTATLVEIVSCTNSGGVTPVGTVTVQPLVNQMTGARQAVPHGQLFNCLYSRISGGENAVIMDPKVGDIGLMVFCSRDISGVRANLGQANPGSFRTFDWADGVYVGGVPLGVTPTQYVQFEDAGITVVSPTVITLRAPTVNIDASTGVNIDSPLTAATGDVTAGTISLQNHEHPPGTYNIGGTPVTGQSGLPVG